MNFWLFFISLFTAVNLCCDQVVIFTYAYARSDLLYYHLVGLKKFVVDSDVELHVCNDADDPEMRAKISKVCQDLGVIEHQIDFYTVHVLPQRLRPDPQDPYNPAVRMSALANHVMHHLALGHQGVIVILENDIFLTRPFKFELYMAPADIAFTAIIIEQIEHAWPGFLLCKTTSISDFDDLQNLQRKTDFSTGHVDGYERGVGGKSCFFLQNHPLALLRYLERPGMNQQSRLSPDKQFDSHQRRLFANPQYGFENFIYNNFVHFGKACTPPENVEFYKLKNYMLTQYLRFAYEDPTLLLDQIPVFQKPRY